MIKSVVKIMRDVAEEEEEQLLLSLHCIKIHSILVPEHQILLVEEMTQQTWLDLADDPLLQMIFVEEQLEVVSSEGEGIVSHSSSKDVVCHDVHSNLFIQVLSHHNSSFLVNQSEISNA